MRAGRILRRRTVHVGCYFVFDFFFGTVKAIGDVCETVENAALSLDDTVRSVTDGSGGEGKDHRIIKNKIGSLKNPGRWFPTDIAFKVRRSKHFLVILQCNCMAEAVAEAVLSFVVHGSFEGSARNELGAVELDIFVRNNCTICEWDFVGRVEVGSNLGKECSLEVVELVILHGRLVAGCFR